MTGFELGSSGIGSNRAINCATTTAQSDFSFGHLNYNVLKFYNKLM